VGRLCCWDVFGVLGSRRCDDTNRRILQARCYGHTHTGAESVVHIPVTGVRYVEMGFVVVAHGEVPDITHPST